MARVLATGTALPRHRYAQARVKRAYAAMFAGDARLERYLGIFNRSGVRQRHFAKPLGYYDVQRPFSERNRDYASAAVELSVEAASRCLRAAGSPPEEVDYLVWVTTTGLATPSLDAAIAQRLGLRAHVRRNPVFGTGCASGAVALARAAEFLAARPRAKALVISAELCSLTLRRGDRSIENLVACALFADGAAAVLLGSGGTGPRLLAWKSHLFPGTSGVMGWDFGEDGMKLVLTPEVPTLARQRLPGVVQSFLRAQGIASKDVRHWLLHPGGLKVVEAYEQAFSLSPRQTRWSRRCLERVGNLSSASVLFMLQDLLSSGEPAPGDHGLLLALGPGFAAEMALLRWD